MADYGASDTSTTTLGANQFPIADVYVPNVGLRATEGGPASTDGTGKPSAPVSMYVKDGGNVTQGATTDTAATTDTGTFTLMALVKRLLAKFPSIGQQTKANSLSVTMASDQTSMPIQIVDVAGVNIAGVDASNRVKIAPAPANAAVIIGQVKLVDSGGTNQAGVASSTGANANGNPQLIAGAFQEVAGQGIGVVNAQNTDLIPATDVSAYKWASLQLTGTWSLTLQAQLCNDNANFNQIQVMSAQTQVTNAAMLNTIGSNGLYVFPITSRYLRVRATAFTSNTSLVGTLELYTSTPPFVVSVAGSTFSVAPQVSGGPTTFHLIGAATTNATLLKNAIGQVYGYDFSNNSSNWAYVKFYNKATAPAPGTDTPVRTVGVPPGGKATYHSSEGIPFSTGIGISTSGGATATTSIQDLDNTAIAVNTVTIDIEYK